MGLDSRGYHQWREEGGGGIRAMFRRIFGDGENPLNWALPLYRAWGIQVKIHLIFIIVIIARLIWSIPQDRIYTTHMLMAMGGLFVLVLLHEYGHCIACRRVGGTADQILMWPLGGLASCATPHHWKADLITTIGGPAVNAILWPMFALLLWAVLPAGRAAGVLIFNPFDPVMVLTGLDLRLADGTQPFWLAGLWWIYYLNIVLLALNVLLPMYPMDGGRIMHALLWRKMGYNRATSLAAKIGLGIAIAVFILAITGNSVLLAGVAIFAGIICWMEIRRLKMMEDPIMAEAGYDFSRGYQGLPGDEDEAGATSRAEEKRRKKEEQEQAELDRILAKIADTGMASLSRGEKRWLEKATQKRRGR